MISQLAWLLVLAVSGAVILGFSIALLLRRRRSASSDAQKHPLETRSDREKFQSAPGRLHIPCKCDSTDRSLRFHHLNQQHHAAQARQQQQQGQLFNWDDHPGLISEAVENGWSGFTFLSRSSARSRPGSLLAFFLASDSERQREVETGWEVPLGSVNFMQTVRLNPGFKRIGSSRRSSPLDGGDSFCSSRMALPLPGPPMADSSFPKQAYFEITILQLQQPSGARKPAKGSSGVQDQLNLIQDNSIDCCHSGETIHNVVISTDEGDGRFKDVVISAGFTRAVDGSSRNKPPGSYPGSIAFNSNGSVHLDGKKLVFEQDKENWGAVNRVIGCGFDPSEKKVFFTMDSVLLHIIHCKNEAFKSPLYPSLAANTNVMVLVNLGQNPFKYMPANTHRTPDPCFLRLRPSAAASDRVGLVGYEDSRELFSIENIGTQWKDKYPSMRSCITPSGNKDNREEGCQTVGSIVVDIGAETELFEISLNG